MGRFFHGIFVRLFFAVGWRLLILDDLRRHGTHVWIRNSQPQDIQKSKSYWRLDQDTTAILPCLLLQAYFNHPT